MCGFEYDILLDRGINFVRKGLEDPQLFGVRILPTGHLVDILNLDRGLKFERVSPTISSSLDFHSLNKRLGFDLDEEGEEPVIPFTKKVQRIDLDSQTPTYESLTSRISNNVEGNDCYIIRRSLDSLSGSELRKRYGFRLIYPQFLRDSSYLSCDIKQELIPDLEKLLRGEI